MIILFAAIAAGVLFLAHAAPFPFALDALRRDDVVWRMPSDPDGPRIYLTFDDGPNPLVTPALLDVLQREQATATFFLIDYHITPDTEALVRRIADEGHGIALHSGMREFAFKSPEELGDALERAATRIERITGRLPCRAFRPHAGIRSSRLLEELDRLDYVMVGWGWNLWDWNWFKRRTPASVVPRLVAHASDGDIIVVHDGDHRRKGADRAATVETTARLVPALYERGFEFATVCEGLALDADHRAESR